MKKLVSISIVILLLVGGGAWAAVWDGIPSKDVGLYGGAHSGKNFGAAISGDCGYWGFPYYRTIAKWDLPLDLIGAMVTSATLEWDVRESSVASGETTVDVFIGGVEHTWVEGTGLGDIDPDGATNETYDGTNSWDYLAPLTVDVNGYVMYDTASVPLIAYVNDLTVAGTILFDDITALVQEWADGRPNYGLALTKTETQNGGVSVFCRESVPSSGPRLHIEYHNPDINVPYLDADINKDGYVNISDLEVLSEDEWLNTGQ